VTVKLTVFVPDSVNVNEAVIPVADPPSGANVQEYV
jgi:hypothetical protein